MSQVINLSSAPNQTFSVSLNINGSTVPLKLSVAYNRIGKFWAMNIADSGGAPLVSPVPLLTGVWPAANILMPYQYMNIGSAYVINVSGTPVDYPNDTDLGTDFILLWDDNADYVSGQQFGGSVIVVGPPGPPGPPGVVGGINVLGTSGVLTPSLTGGGLTQQADLTGNASIADLVGGTEGGIFVVQLIQPPAGNCSVTFSSYYRGLGLFGLDTTGSTQAVLWFQIDPTNTYALLLNVTLNGSPIS